MAHFCDRPQHLKKPQRHQNVAHWSWFNISCSINWNGNFITFNSEAMIRSCRLLNTRVQECPRFHFKLYYCRNKSECLRMVQEVELIKSIIANLCLLLVVSVEGECQHSSVRVQFPVTLMLKYTYPSSSSPTTSGLQVMCRSLRSSCTYL